MNNAKTSPRPTFRRKPMINRAIFYFRSCQILTRNSPHIQHLLNLSVGVVFLMIFVLIISMATISRFNAHPDEYVQAEAVTYYKSHWLPPAINDPAIRNNFSVYGHSRLVGWSMHFYEGAAERVGQNKQESMGFR